MQTVIESLLIISSWHSWFSPTSAPTPIKKAAFHTKPGSCQSPKHSHRSFLSFLATGKSVWCSSTCLEKWNFYMEAPCSAKSSFTSWQALLCFLRKKIRRQVHSGVAKGNLFAWLTQASKTFSAKLCSKQILLFKDKHKHSDLDKNIRWM